MTKNSWRPWLVAAEEPLYRRLAMALRQDMEAGRLLPGDRLPTHRELASALTTTVVTASRAYREAAAWGLIQGEVGRGTFVAAAQGARRRAGEVPEFFDLGSNYLAVDTADFSPAVEAKAVRQLWQGIVRRYPPGGATSHRHAAATWLRREGWTPREGDILATSGAQHSILVALTALTRPGDALYVEELTYHGVKAVARTLGLRLVPLAIDEHGLLPEALAGAGARGGLLFCQPALHNPTSSVMPVERRREIARLARQLDLTILEDCVYEFLLADPPLPLAALAPERTCHLVSGAKAFAQGLRVGYIAAPERLVPQLQSQIAATGLAASAGLLDLVTSWILQGTASDLVARKRRAAAERQALAARAFAGILGARTQTHPASSHLWLELPAPWTAASFVELARERGVAVNPASAFAVDMQQAPTAVRICLGPLSNPQHLELALGRLTDLLAAPPPPDELIV